MSFAKELLFSCVVMMHVSFVVMGPLGKQSIYKSLEDFGLALGNLCLAEKKYVELIFTGSPPTYYNTWDLSENITFGNSTEEIQASVCAIIDYLGNHLPNITKNLTTGNQFHPIINNTNKFLHPFKIAVKPNVEVKKCKKGKIETSHGYAIKEMGLRFLYSSKRWVEHFTKIDC